MATLHARERLEVFTHEMGTSPHMIPYHGSFDAKWINLFLLLLVVALTSACGSNEPIEEQVEAKPEEPEFTAREWYPSSKHQQLAPTQYAPVMMQPAGVSAQQPWAVNAPQPAYVAPQVVYQLAPQPVQQVQQSSVWSGHAPAPVTQQPQAYWHQPATQSQAPVQAQQQPTYYYQPVQRPWGNPTQPAYQQQPRATTDTWPQGSYVIAPWGVPASGFNGSGAGQVIQPYVAPGYGHVW